MSHCDPRGTGFVVCCRETAIAVSFGRCFIGGGLALSSALGGWTPQSSGGV